MKTAALFLVAFLAVVSPPTFQAEAPGTAMLSDASDDQVVQVQPAGAVPNDVRWSGLDLRSLGMDETEEEFLFHLEVADLAPDGEDVLLADDTFWDVHFTFGRNIYTLEFGRWGAQPVADGVAFYAYLLLLDPATGDSSYIADLETPAVDLTSNVITGAVPRRLLEDGDGAPPAKGGALTDLWADSWLVLQNLPVEVADGVTVQVRGNDRMPDSGVAEAVWSIVNGLEQTGHVVLSSASPVRVSNGEATTFLFELQVTNRADFTDTVTLSVAGAPDVWVVTLPEETVRLDGDETVTVPILVTTPFGHEHGVYVPLLVEGHSRADPTAVGRMELGVRYTAVPQPAGHHDSMWLHSAQGGTRVFMNTMETYGGDSGEEVQSRGSCSCNGMLAKEWTINLEPALLMGMDWDTDREGTFTVPIKFDIPTLGAYVSGGFSVFPPGEGRSAYFDDGEYRVADLQTSEPVDVGAGETVSFTLPIKPTAYGDYLPYAPDSRLTLGLVVWMPNASPGVCCLVGPEPVVVPGGSMQLPLEEYHDDVDDYFSALSGIELRPVSEQQRLVNPGKTALFQVEATNIGAVPGTFRIEVTGTHADWTQVLGDLTFTLGAGETRPLAMAIVPPAGTDDGELVDVTLHATKKDDDNVRSLIRLLAEVDTDADHPDDAEAAADVDADLREAPGPGLLAGISLLGALVAVRRRTS